jgi:TPR repeat protein
MRAVRLIAIVFAVLAADLAGAAPYRAGHAYTQSPYAAVHKLRWRAEQGDVNAQAELAWNYSIGRGVPQNYYKAAKWYHRAAEAGHGGAQFALGLLYNKGQGVPKDLPLSYMWLNLSASQAVGDIRDFKMRMRDSIASKLTPEELDVAQHWATDWTKLH